VVCKDNLGQNWNNWNRLERKKPLTVSKTGNVPIFSIKVLWEGKKKRSKRKGVYIK